MGFCLVSLMSDSLQPHGLWPTRLLRPWNFPGKNIGAYCHFLLQGIFLTQGSNLHLLCLLYCRQTLYHWVTGDIEKEFHSDTKTRIILITSIYSALVTHQVPGWTLYRHDFKYSLWKPHETSRVVFPTLYVIKLRFENEISCSSQTAKE